MRDFRDRIAVAGSADAKAILDNAARYRSQPGIRQPGV